MKEKTTDQLIETLYHINDRRRYRLVCGLDRGPDYAQECKAESDILHELSVRGVPDYLISDCYPAIKAVII